MSAAILQWKISGAWHRELPKRLCTSTFYQVCIGKKSNTCTIVLKQWCCLYSYEDKVEHYRVWRDTRGWVAVDDEEYFENLAKLVKVRIKSSKMIDL